MNTAAIIFMGKILAWILLSGSALMLVGRAIYAVKYQGSKEQRMDQLRGRRVRFPFILQSVLFLASLFYIVGFWGVTQ